ncbi:MAG TPA: DUF1349 domain-containing protein [Geminicoccus sp.]|jgi:hypothetical protein|uniref:DUF1349 domain-containing protein n=1 Tax=Geminicoccus sp. TaxID=2024832 RepID=UPI002E32982B|nr:DUF1349 domain-containing protein [Geminicoccus sp.]HEX2528046.1 DUF1349 domain-containing protein [Geminicoccus sp.]
MFERCSWLNEPRSWQLAGDVLRVTTDKGTDFWRETHYGFTRHSGHFFGALAEGGFTAQLRVQARYEQLYDQAGVMVRIDEAHWVKSGIELSDSMPLLSSVLTVGRSDWATGAFSGDPADFWIRATVADGVLRLQCSLDGKAWPLVRLCPFPASASYRVGPMCCTPERAGLDVQFSNFTIGPPSGKDLHDLS